MADEIIIDLNIKGAKEEIKNLNQIQLEINDLADSKKKLAAEEKRLRKAIEDKTATEEESVDALREVAEQQSKNNLLIKEAKKEQSEKTKVVAASAQINKLAAGSVAQLAAQHTKDKDALRLLSKEERENTKAGQALTKKVKEQSDELKEIEKSYGTTSRSVGDYGIAMQDTLPLMGGFGSQIQNIIGQLGGIKSAIGKFSAAQKGMATSTNGANKSLKSFRIALISTGIGAIVVALGALVAAFLSTQRGVDAVTKYLRPLQEIMSSLLGVVQDLATKGVDRLKKAFDNPKQAVIDFGNAIKDRILTSILAIPKVITGIGKSSIAGFKLMALNIKKALADVPLIGKGIDKKKVEADIARVEKQAKEALIGLGKATIELGIGVDADEVLAAGKEAGEFFKEAAARGTQIDQLTKQIERIGVSLNREKQTANRLFNEQKLIAENTKLSAQEQLAAATKAQEILKGVTKLEVDQQNRQIKLAQLKAEANDTDIEGQTEIQNLIADREQIEADAIQKGLELRNKANGIAKTEEARVKKAIADREKVEAKAIADKTALEVKAIDDKIKALELGRQLELATIDETNEEKLQREREFLDNVGALRVEKARLNGENVAEVELENQIIKAEKEKEAQAVIDEEENTRLAEQEAFKQHVRSETVDIAVQGGKALIDAANTRAEREKDIELANLNAKLEGGLISQEEFEKQKLAIEKKAFNKKKGLDLAVIAIDLAKELSAISAAAAANPANSVTFGAAGLTQAATLSAIAVAKSGVQAAVVASQKFAQGGIIHGASHAQGGVNIGNNQEAEGGEAIINKRSTRKHLGLLSAINQDGGGVALGGLASPNTATVSRFANGGVTNNTVTNSGVDIDELRQALADSVGSIKVQNVASETTGVANRVEQIQDSASF
jgi:hypothetical protein